jgi:hypothetical protein
VVGFSDWMQTNGDDNESKPEDDPEELQLVLMTVQEKERERERELIQEEGCTEGQGVQRVS